MLLFGVFLWRFTVAVCLSRGSLLPCFYRLLFVIRSASSCGGDSTTLLCRIRLFFRWRFVCGTLFRSSKFDCCLFVSRFSPPFFCQLMSVTDRRLPVGVTAPCCFADLGSSSVALLLWHSLSISWIRLLLACLGSLLHSFCRQLFVI